MTSFLGEIGKKLAERWLTSVVLPGVLFMAVLFVAWAGGWTKAIDLDALVIRLAALARKATTNPEFAVVLVVGTLLAASGSGLLAQGLGSLVQRIWVSKRPAIVVRFRHARSSANLARYRPARLTSIGDRFYLLNERIDVQYGLSVSLAWPRLWLLLKDPAPAAINSVYNRYRSAAATSGWGIMYGLVGAAWWPAIVVGVVMILVGYRRALTSSVVLSNLLEAAVDTHQVALATVLGISLPEGRITPPEGGQINNILNKRA